MTLLIGNVVIVISIRYAYYKKGSVTMIWTPITGTKGENFYMSKDEKYYISRPVFSRKGWELSRRNVIDGVVVYTFIKAFSSLKAAKNYVANTLHSDNYNW